MNIMRRVWAAFARACRNESGLMGIPASYLETGTWSANLGSGGTGARLEDVIYQNTSGTKRRVWFDASFPDGANTYEIQVGSANPPTARVTIGPTGTLGGAFIEPAYFEVPDQHYWRIATASGAPSFTRLFEMDE